MRCGERTNLHDHPQQQLRSDCDFHGASARVVGNQERKRIGVDHESPSGINCPGDCAQDFDSGSSVTLTANPDLNVDFTGWTGCDSVDGDECTVAMTSARNVTGAFSPTQRALSVSKTGSGTGTVSSVPVGVDCGSDCNRELRARHLGGPYCHPGGELPVRVLDGLRFGQSERLQRSHEQCQERFGVLPTGSANADRYEGGFDHRHRDELAHRHQLRKRLFPGIRPRDIGRADCRPRLQRGVRRMDRL